MAEETMMEAASALTLLGLANPKRSRAASEDSPSSKRPKLLAAPKLVALQQILTQSELENDSPKAVGQRKLLANSKNSVNSRPTTGVSSPPGPRGSFELRGENAKLAALEVAANTIREALGGASSRRPHTDEYEQGKIDLLANGLQTNNKRSIATPAPSGTHLSVVPAVPLPGHGVEVNRPAKRPSLKEQKRQMNAQTQREAESRRRALLNEHISELAFLTDQPHNKDKTSVLMSVVHIIRNDPLATPIRTVTATPAVRPPSVRFDRKRVDGVEAGMLLCSLNCQLLDVNAFLCHKMGYTSSDLPLLHAGKGEFRNILNFAGGLDGASGLGSASQGLYTIAALASGKKSFCTLQGTLLDKNGKPSWWVARAQIINHQGHRVVFGVLKEADGPVDESKLDQHLAAYIPAHTFSDPPCVYTSCGCKGGKPCKLKV